MSADVYLAHSSSWMHERLLRDAVLDPAVARLVDSPRTADLIVFPTAAKRDPEARDRLGRLRPRELRRTFVYSQEDRPFPGAPGVYVSLPASRASAAYRGGCYVVHHHAGPGGLFEDLEAAQEAVPDLLWSFAGTASNHPVRARLLELRDERGLAADTQAWSERIRWGWESEHRDEGRAAFESYATTLGRSAFAVCPRGRGAATIRLFEAMQARRCPVILSDEWLPPPFVDWDSCAIRIPEARVAELPEMLRAREPEAAALGRRARAVWERFFRPEAQLQTLISTCLEIAAGRPSRTAALGAALLHPQGLREAASRVKGRLA